MTAMYMIACQMDRYKYLSVQLTVSTLGVKRSWSERRTMINQTLAAFLPPMQVLQSPETVIV